MKSVILRHYNKFLVAAESIADLFAILLAFSAGSAIYLYLHPTLTHNPHSSVVAITTAIVGVLIFERLGLYRQQVSLMNLVEIRKIIRATFVLCLGLIIYSYFQKIHFPRSLLVYNVILVLLFVLIERTIFFKLQQALYIRGFNVRRTLILGAGENGRLLHQSIAQAPKLGYFVVGFLDENQKRLLHAKEWFEKSTNNGLIFCDGYSKLSNIVRTHQIDEIFISNPLHSMGAYTLQTLATLCQKLEINLNFIPYVIRGYFANQLHINDINGIPMISFKPIPISHAEQLSKRIFDIILASITLLLFCPFFLVIPLLINHDSKGSVFFKQMRVGKNGAHFQMYKFRTMHVDTPQYANSPKTAHDPRITKIGKFLRKTSLDELPQLFNVIRGDMSLVGPRPEMPFIVDNEYNDLIRERLRVKPGVTGVWQISGDRTREIHENISYDLFYIENRSLLLDTIILIRTLLFGIMAMRTH